MYHPVYDTLTYELIEWTDDEGNRYPENPDHVAAMVAEHTKYIEERENPLSSNVDDWGVPYDTKWNALFE